MYSRIARWTLAACVLLRIPPSSADVRPGDEQDQPSPLHKSFIAVGFGDRFGLKSEDLKDAPLISVDVGQRVFDSIHLIEQVTSSSGVSYSSSGSTHDTISDWSIGARWTPQFQPRRSQRYFWSPYRHYDLASLFFEGTVGLAIRQREVFDVASGRAKATKLGGTGRAGVGYLPMQGRDYAFGFIARGAVTRYSHETTFELQFVVVAQLTH